MPDWAFSISPRLIINSPHKATSTDTGYLLVTVTVSPRIINRPLRSFSSITFFWVLFTLPNDLTRRLLIWQPIVINSAENGLPSPARLPSASYKEKTSSNWVTRLIPSNPPRLFLFSIRRLKAREKCIDLPARGLVARQGCQARKSRNNRMIYYDVMWKDTRSIFATFISCFKIKKENWKEIAINRFRKRIERTLLLLLL